jgi:EEF1A lysine methyltransferase 4
MPGMTPPSFGSSQYWETRFTRSPQSFDWLVNPSILIPPLLKAISNDTSFRSGSRADPRILHIGCGTSGLSNLLRRHVLPSTILNVDFSHRAIELGIQREREEFGVVENEEGKGFMAWETADLLDWSSIQRAIGHGYGDSKPVTSYNNELALGDSKPSTRDPKFSIVIEKSCADAIACGEDIEIPVPYRIRNDGTLSNKPAELIHTHPVCLLACHLAALTKPGGMWIALSYSESRFDCLYENEEENRDFARRRNEGSVPDPGKLWTLVLKYEMVAQMEGMEKGVYRPRISHWLYLLRRTELKVA